MRVLVLGDLASPHSLRWAEAMAGRGHEVLRIGFGEPAASSLPYVELGTRELTDRRYLTGLPRWFRQARAFAPDVVHSHFVASYGLMASLGGVGAPVVQFAWGSDIMRMDRLPGVRRRLIGRAVRRAATVVVDADEVGERVAALAPSTPRIAVVFGPERAWTEVQRGATTSILSPRGFRAFYNVRSIIEAFARVAPDAPDWTLDVLTGGDDPAELAAVARDLGISERVRFHGRLTRAELQERFLAAEVVCSVPSNDATSVALLEGMATGAYPIVSDLAANRAWVSDGVNGAVVPAGDVGALAAALGSVIADPERRRRSAVTNRAMIAERGSWETAVDAVDARTRQVVEERPRRSRRADSQRSVS